ncbi:MAG: hydrogenase expression/formation protein HypE [Cyanobacteria bacterium NC_groundwater_1444_Ag_S-0.65um_54_12]|nr:hydrogenase expression/formation protein HypE [Cyanobacteria bacterium NC_groundwater_1444_Ag_S-0.65um_54_12]
MTTIRHASKPLDYTRGVIDLSHGSGGRAMAQLISELFAKEFANEFLAQGNDQAILPASAGRLALATDSFVVSPLFFPGGNIGELAVNGTVNDLAMGGARPLHLTASFIIEEGFPLADLRHIVIAMAHAASNAELSIVAGDTKVVERGKADGLFICTTGLGSVPAGCNLSGKAIRPGDQILLSGTIGDHGVAIMGCRANLGLSTQIISDTAALHGLVTVMIETGPSLRCMRDPTRGGLAVTLNELANQSGVGMLIYEDRIPIKEEVAAACEILGLDPLYVANEGKLIAICAPEDAPELLAAMRSHPRGQLATIIGEVCSDPRSFVRMQTAFGGTRVVDWLAGVQLPRIC